MRPYSQLKDDLLHDNTARYNFIVPDLCNDMTGSPTECIPSLTDLVSYGDGWLSEAVPPILDSSGYKNGGVLFIVWDEGLGLTPSDRTNRSHRAILEGEGRIRQQRPLRPQLAISDGTDHLRSAVSAWAQCERSPRAFYFVPLVRKGCSRPPCVHSASDRAPPMPARFVVDAQSSLIWSSC